jgi:predicted RNA-binding protein YlqC (UPF0109 family)
LTGAGGTRFVVQQLEALALRMVDVAQANDTEKKKTEKHLSTGRSVMVELTDISPRMYGKIIGQGGRTIKILH